MPPPGAVFESVQREINMFNPIKSLLSFFSGSDQPSGFIVRSKHRETHGHFEEAFETAAELDAFLAGYQPTAHLTYVTTSVYACYGNKEELIELHQHLTANLDWERARFDELAAAMAAEIQT